MSADTVFNAFFAAQFIAGAVILYRLCRTRRPSEQERAERAQARVEAPPAATPDDANGWQYNGPDSLRLVEDLTAHLKAYGEAIADYYDTTGDRP